MNAHGSERLDLPVRMNAEYWNGATWQLNSNDTCTGDTTLGATNAISLALVATTPVSLNPSSTCVQDTGNPGRSGIGCISAGVLTKQFKEGTTPSTGFAGDFNLWLKAPGAGGGVNVQATVPTWLQFNWTGAVGNPSSRATFGVYKGGPVIFMREMY